MHKIKCDTKLGFVTDEEEVNAMVYLTFGSQTSYLAVGTTSGQLTVLDLATMQPCFKEADFIASEIVYLQFRKALTSPAG